MVFYLFIHAVLGIGLSSMIEMAASTDCRKLRLMSHEAYIKSVAGTDDLLRLIVSCSAVKNMSLELIKDSHTNRHMATAQHIGPLTQLPQDIVTQKVLPGRKCCPGSDSRFPTTENEPKINRRKLSNDPESATASL